MQEGRGRPRQDRDDERWQQKDAWLGALFLVFGVLVTVYAVLACRNGMPVAFWGPGFVAGPTLLLLGVNAIVRASRG